MNFRFNITKATEGACQFIERSGGTINIMKLVKLVYLLDRLSLARRGTGYLVRLRSARFITQTKGLPAGMRDFAVGGISVPNEEAFLIRESALLGSTLQLFAWRSFSFFPSTCA